MKRLITLLGILLIISAIFITGCTSTEIPTPKPDPQQEIPSVTQNIGEYFPLTMGSTWQYKGEGNEYASFIRKVLYTKEDKAQVQEDNGGTISQSVYEITDTEIIRIFFQGEEYDEKSFLNEELSDNTIILKRPIEVGTQWEEPNAIREIVEIDASVETPAGQFDNCIKVEIYSQNSSMFEYYKEGIGLVKREFISGETKVTSTLEKYKINP